MRVLLAGLFHETHCFVPDRTPLSDFSVARGDELLGFRGNGSMIDGFLEVAAAESWQVVPAVSFMATPSGIVEDRVVESFLADFDAVATKRECDAVFLALHGAMVSESVEDVEGMLLSRLRAVPSLARVPVVGVFDLHATLTPAMAAGADALVCYRENPHVDARESAVRAAGLLARIGAEGHRPRMHYRHAGVIWPPTGTGTADTPMRDLEALARKIEAEDPEIRAVNVVAGFSFADVADAGVSFSVVSTGSAGRAEAALARLADAAMELRDAGLPAEMTPAAAISAAARATGSGPALLVEPSDNIGGGAPGNGTVLLRALLAARHPNAGIILADAEAVAALADTTPGSRRRLRVGGRDNPMDPGPVELEVELVARSDGRFTLEDRQSHAAAASGVRVDMGPTAVVRHAGITLLLTTRKTPPFDLGQWRSQGIEPERLDLIVVKAAVAHRRAYDRIMRASYTVATPGPCTSDPRQLPYRRLARPVYPLHPRPRRPADS